MEGEKGRGTPGPHSAETLGSTSLHALQKPYLHGSSPTLAPIPLPTSSHASYHSGWFINR